MITSRGWVVKKYEEGEGQKLLDLEIYLDIHLGPSATVASLTLDLPAKKFIQYDANR